MSDDNQMSLGWVQADQTRGNSHSTGGDSGTGRAAMILAE